MNDHNKRLALERILDSLGGAVLGNPTPFSRALREARYQAGKTQHEFAEFLDVPIPRVSEYEHGYRPPMQSEELERVAAFLSADPTQLLAAAARTRGELRVPIPEDMPTEDVVHLVEIARRVRGQEPSAH
jgi:transcriptional regulator with XRE-family HTH domain